MYFRFLDDVMFSHNGANKAESKRRYVWSSSPGGGTETKFDVYDWLVLFQDICLRFICELFLLSVSK